MLAALSGFVEDLVEVGDGQLVYIPGSSETGQADDVTEHQSVHLELSGPLVLWGP